MMKNITLLILIIACSLGCKPKINSETLINDTIDKYRQHQSISYDITYTMKFFDEDEPLDVKSHVLIKRVVNDSIFKSKFLYNRRDSLLNVSKYYDNFLYVIDHNEEKITRYKEDFSPITGAVDGNLIDTYFHNIEKIEKKLRKEDIQVSYKDSIDFLKLTFQYSDFEDYYGMEESIYIRKSTKTIEKITYQAKYKDQIQINKWLLSNIKFDDVRENDFEKAVTNYFENYTLEDYKPLTEEDFKLLENGIPAPKIKGKIYPNYKDEITWKSDKILVIDFWYTTCMPCIKAIPHLNKLQENYKDYIEVVGVNPFEGKESQKEKIEAFLKREPIDYPILFVDHTITEEYNVKVYPSLYIIGKDGKVKFSKLGTSDNLYEELEAELKKIIH
jgi:thiol-disulfide isomerase/thioredoxin